MSYPKRAHGVTAQLNDVEAPGEPADVKAKASLAYSHNQDIATLCWSNTAQNVGNCSPFEPRRREVQGAPRGSQRV